MNKKPSLPSHATPSAAAGTRQSPRLVRRGPSPMALEQRFMFDGAAVAEAVHELAAPEPAEAAPPAELLAFDTPATLPAAVVSARAEAERLVGEMLAGPDAREQLFALFNGGQQQPSEAWDSRVDALLQQMAAGEYQLPVQLVSDTTLQGARAAFTAAGPDGGPVIYLNGDWVQGGADTDSLTRALSEEIGHALDAYLNGRDDTAGDEGEAFSYLLANGVLRLEAVSGLSDHGTIEIAGQQVEAEFANYRFVAAYQMVYDLNNNGTVEGNLGETAAEKEQNLHNFNATDLGQVTVDDGIGSRMFSGNDVSASAIVIGGTTYYGWISRPIKANGVVRGFYFWTDTDFVDLTSAQADGNMDRDANTADNRGFVLVVDQAWFNAQITATRTTVATDIDGVAGQHTYSNVGSSSDRVDTALNSLLSTNTVTAAPDVLVVNEDSAATTGNLLANDSDANNDRFTLTGYTIAGLSGAQPLGQDVLIAGVGTIRIASSGAYSFTPAADYTGAVPVISYTITDSWGATSTTTFSINVAPGNDPPTAVNDSHTLVEDTPATGNVLASDSDPDGDVLVVTGFSIAGQAGPFTLGSAYAIAGVGSFTLFANGSYSFVPAANYTGAVPVVSYAISDGKGGTSSATLGLVVSPVNDAPTAVADNADSALYATAAGCANGVPVAATTQSGNVLANDTDPDLAVVPGVTHEVSAVTGSTGAVWNGTTVSGRYGILTIAADGSYSYAIDGSNAAVLALAAGQSLSETFSYTLREIGSTALSSTSTLRIVIRGSNNAPEARDDAEAVNELAASQTTNTVVNYGTASAVASGVLANDTDPDGGTLTVVDIAAAGTATATFQTSTSETNLVLTFSGTPSQLTSSFYVYYLDAGLSDTSPVLLYADAGLTTALRPSSVVGNGSNRNVNLSTNGAVYYSDGLGGSVALSLTQNTVLGFDDVSSNPSGANYYRATISSAPTVVSSASFTVSAATGTLANGMTVTCTDAGFGSFAAQVSGLQYNATTGQIESFTLSSASNSFTPGASYQLVFDSKVSAGATLQGQYGYVEIAANGAYTYYLTSNALAAGQVFTERFTYTVSDGSCTDTAVLSIRVTGTQTQLTDTADTELEDTANTGSVPVGGQALSSFTWDGQTASAGQTLTVAGVGSLTLAGDGSYTFSPASNYTGPVPTATYLVTDGAAATLSLAITPVNDAPAGTDKTVTLTDKQGYTFSAADFGFSDMDDAPSNSLESVRVTAIPTLTAGSLRLNGTSVQAGDVISVAQLGNLVYTPLENASQGPRLVFTFQVIDDGGTANGGVNTDPTPNTFTIEVTPVNDAPVNTLPSALTTPSYQAISFASLPTVISAGDPDSLSDLRNIQTVVLSVSSGTLSLTAGAGVSIAGNGTGAVTLTSTGSGSAGQAQLQAVLASLVYQPLSTFHGLDLLQVVTTDKEGLADIDTLSITVQPDDRPLVVTGTQVNEASPYLLFEVDGEVGQWVTLALGSTGSGIGHAELGTDVLLGLQYFDGAAWVDYTGQAVQIPATVAGGAANTGGRMLVRVAVVQDSAWESTAAAYETLSLTAWNQVGTPNTISGALDAFDEGLGRIRDDGQGAIYQGDSNSFTPYTPVSGDPLPDDDRPLGVDDVWVNEGSPYAVFTVSGVAGQWVTLALGEGAASQENGDGTVASDGSEDFGARLQYWDGSAWADYSAGSWVQIPLGGSTLLVRTAIVDDALNEGQHDFRLTVGNTGGSFAFGTAVIDDHGAGVKYPDAAPDGNGIPATSTQLLDDDRPLTVNDITVNEASPTALFTVTGAAGQQVSLQLVATGSATGDATLGTDTANVPTRQVPLQYSTDGGASWTDYNAGSRVTLVGTTLLVRTGIAQDGNFEGAETFRLVATNTGGTPNVQTAGHAGIATILDDGTGTVFKDDGSNDTVATRDDDRPLAVDDITVNEASPTAVFTVTGAAGQQMSLQLVATGSATGDATLGTDTGDVPSRAVPLQYSTDSGASWADYNAGSYVTLVGSTLLVRTGITQDTTYEGAETFRLVATNTGGSANVTSAGNTGTATIVDDGTGTVFKDDGSDDSTALRDDDRLVTVTGGTYNEDSARAVFTLQAYAGQWLTLDVQDAAGTGKRPTAGLDSAALYYSTDGGAIWLRYTAPFAAGSVPVLVAVDIAAERDAAYEGEEQLRLVVNPGQQTESSAYASIVDDGTGVVTDPIDEHSAGSTGTDNGQPKDDDRPLAVTGGSYNENSPRAVFTVHAHPGQHLTLDVLDAAGTGKQPTGSEPGTADDLDDAPLYYSVDGGASWQRYTGAFVAGTADVLVAVDISAERDDVYEGQEQLRLVVNPGRPTEAWGHASIFDDGTGAVTASLDESSTTHTTGADTGLPRDDDRRVSVNDISVNEGSPYGVFTLSGTPGLPVTLALQDGSASAADYGPTLEASSDGGRSWVPYTGGGVALGSEGQLLVRTPIRQDTLFEGRETFGLRVGRPDGASVVGSAAITDDGTGTVYGPDGAEDSSTRKDDDRPVGQVPPPAPPPPAPVAVPAPAPLPPVEAPQVTQAPFDSTLQSPGASPLVLVPQVIMESLTSERGFPIVVLQGATPALTLHGGVSDQFVEPDRASRFALPADTFAHTKRDAVISLSAMQADGTPLPPWVQFDPQSGTFTVDAPPGFTGELKLLVIARDDEGREARAPFRLFVGEETAKPKPPGRAGLSEQLKLAGKRAGALPDWLRLAPAKAVPERASPDKQAAPREVV